ncbi:MAG: hypothetical protein RML94_01810 [Bacteroidia bacterium]|nr:hypothetical protein [Bacteroidia bacterium]
MTFKKQTTTTTQNNTSKRWNKIGSILRSKNGTGFYIKMDKSVSLEKGEVLTVINPRDTVERMIQSGRWTEKEGQKRLEKIPDFVRYEIFLVND